MRNRVLPLVVLGGLGYGDPVPTSEVIGRVGSSAAIDCPSTVDDLCSDGLIDWRWRPLNSNGWGWSCSRRNNTCNWEWNELSIDSENWRPIYELDSVHRTNNGLEVIDLGMHDNRQYAAVQATTGKIFHIFSLKVGRKPSYPTDIECTSLIECMIMRCTWKIGLQSFLPWAKSTTSLKYRRVDFEYMMYSDEAAQKFNFDENDVLSGCDKYCTEGNVGCCEFKLTSQDLSTKEENDTVTYQIEILTTNVFGSSTMQRSCAPMHQCSSIIHETPSQNIKPLKPKITSVTAPPYDGYSMTIKWSHEQPPNSTIIYKYKLEYRLKSDNLLPWQTSQEIYDYEFKLNAILVPFHQYEFRVKAYPVMIKGHWSDPSDIVIGTTQSTEPTAKLNPKYSIINYGKNTVKIRFFWLPYQQKNAPNNRFRIRVKTGNCMTQHQIRKTLLWDGVIEDSTKTSQEVALDVNNVPCINAEFVVENDKGATGPEIIPIDLQKVDTSAPNIYVRSLSDGKFQMRSDSENLNNPTLYVCYGDTSDIASDISESDLSYRPICHGQMISEADKCTDCPESENWYNSKASLTPCYDYNIYLEFNSKSNNSTVRSTQREMTIDKLSVNMGQLGDIVDTSKDGNPEVKITYDLGNKDNIDIIYGMHPVVSYKSVTSDKVYHKKIKTSDNIIRLNSTDGLVGGSQTSFWLSLCCDERMEGVNSCHPQTKQKMMKISAGTPGSVEHVELAWSKDQSSYQLHFIKPSKTNSPLRSYQIFVKYTQNGNDENFEISVPSNSHETTVQLAPVCNSMLDEVHVTILAYGSDKKRLIPGQPTHRYFQCGDLIIVGLSAGIMFSISVLIIILIVMLVMSYIHRRRLKTYVVDLVWPELEKPKIVFSGNNRDDWNHETEKSELLQEYEETDIPEIINVKLDMSEKKPTSDSAGFDSGISEYSDGSTKSVPIYRLGYRIDFRRTSNASSGISSGTSGSHSGKSGVQSLHTVSSNHSGDSVLAKTNWSKDYHLSIPAKTVQIPEKTQLQEYSVMGDSFNESTLKNRPFQTSNGYIGYVENSIFNLTNMPTVFLDNFKKIQKMREMSPSDNFVDYGGYKPISALFPSQQTQSELPPGYTTSNIFDVPPEWSKNENVFDDDYITDQFLPCQFDPISKAPLLPQAGYLPFDRAMKTFGIDEIPVDNLLSSKLSNFQKHKISANYVSDYSANFSNFPSNIYVPKLGRKTEVPGYVSIEGAQLLQQYS